MKLKHKDLPALRKKLLKQQGGFDPITALEITDPCVDHDHSTGAVRGVLDRRTNAWEGRVRSAFRRCGLQKAGADYYSSLYGLLLYLKATERNQDPLIHPDFLTPEEKRLKRNKKARLKRKRAAKKG